MTGYELGIMIKTAGLENYPSLQSALDSLKIYAKNFFNSSRLARIIRWIKNNPGIAGAVGGGLGGGLLGTAAAGLTGGSMLGGFAGGALGGAAVGGLLGQRYLGGAGDKVTTQPATDPTKAKAAPTGELPPDPRQQSQVAVPTTRPAATKPTTRPAATKPTTKPAATKPTTKPAATKPTTKPT